MKNAPPASASLRAVGGDTLIFAAIILLAVNGLAISLLSDWSAASVIDRWRVVFICAILTAALLGFLLARRGRRLAASAMVTAAAWVSTTVFALGSGIGLHTAALYFYLPCLLYTALFFGVRVAGVLTALTILALLAMYHAEVTGTIGGVQVYLSSTTPFNFLLGVIVSCIAVLVLAAVYQRRIDQESAGVAREAEARRRALLQLEASQDALQQANAEVRALNAELERAVAARTRERDQVNQELESVNYSVAHDLRAPLRAMHSYASMVLERDAPGLDEESRDMLRRVRGAADRMDTLLRALLTYGDIGRRSLRSEPVNLSALVADALARRARALGVEAPESRIEPGCVARGDAALIGQMVEALVDNAVKFGRDADDPQVDFGASQTDGLPTFYLRDRGIGFDPAQIEMLGKPFHHLHADRALDGLGMGLATARRIAERHGGALWARAAPGEGATFYFSLGTPEARAA